MHSGQDTVTDTSYHGRVGTVDHKARHMWARTPRRVRCAYMTCNAPPDPADVAKLEVEDAQRLAMPIDIRYSH